MVMLRRKPIQELKDIAAEAGIIPDGDKRTRLAWLEVTEPIRRTQKISATEADYYEQTEV